MNFDISHAGRTTLSVDYAGAIGLGYPDAIAGAALKVAALAKVAAFADGYRARIASSSAGKLAEYRIKEDIARDPAKAAGELEILTREAKARGITRAALLAQISAQAVAYRQIALLIGALEAEAGSAIKAIPDDAKDVESQIYKALGRAKSEADAAFNEASALINGK